MILPSPIPTFPVLSCPALLVMVIQPSDSSACTRPLDKPNRRISNAPVFQSVVAATPERQKRSGVSHVGHVPRQCFTTMLHVSASA